MATFELLVFVLGDSQPSGHMFHITAPASTSMSELKELVYAKAQSRFLGIDASDLVLWKLHDPIPGEAADERVASLGQDLSAVAVEILQDLSDYFPAAPPPKCLHIVVQRPVTSPMLRSDRKRAREDEGAVSPEGDDTVTPGAKKPKIDVSETLQLGPPVAKIHSSIAPRKSTVDALYKRLNEYRIVLVRGTPASGKSTLARLLKEHICAQEPGAEPILISSWPQNTRGWSSRLTPQYDTDPNAENIVIIDDAQLTYWDDGFWNSFVKSISYQSRVRLILFPSYSVPNHGVSEELCSNIVVPDRSRVSLRPVDHGDRIAPAGLFLMPDEFEDMVEKLYPASCFKADFLDYAFRATAGHTGAVRDLLQVVADDDSYRAIKQDGGEYSLEIFHSHFPMEKLWSRLDSTSIFRRGLPMLSELREPDIARVLRAVLRNNCVTKQLLDSTEDRAPLDKCFKWGWLHATKQEWETLYIFTTHLHQWFVEYYLGTTVTDPTLITDRDLPSFAIKVIELFSPVQLSSPRRIGASNTLRPAEARFQDEFYRCCQAHSKGSLVSFPRFGDASGKIDLYIPLKQWGVELLRDGDGFENHSSRFTGPGAYEKMEFKDSVILDFRTSQPQKSHPEIPNLYHVVFVDDYKNVSIQRGTSLEEIATFELFN